MWSNVVRFRLTTWPTCIHRRSVLQLYIMYVQLYSHTTTVRGGRASEAHVPQRGGASAPINGVLLLRNAGERSTYNYCTYMHSTVTRMNMI